MKKRQHFVYIILLLNISLLFAQDVTTVEAEDSDISDNLDLEAVATIFGESKDLEEFEKKLNDPELQISNLDLNQDGEVDYLRVMEDSEGDTHVVSIQAVISKDEFQNVATIDVEKDNVGETTVQVVGDVYMYGSNYIISPVYVHPPVIYVWFWGPYYSPWRSPYHWGRYPPYYRPRKPYPPHRYRSNVHFHVNVSNSYNYTSVRKSSTSVKIQKNNYKGDYAAQKPNSSFDNRNEGVSNRKELTSDRTKNKSTTGRAVQDDWKGSSDKVKNSNNANRNNNSSNQNKKQNIKKQNINSNNNINKNNKLNIQQKKSNIRKR